MIHQSLAFILRGDGFQGWLNQEISTESDSMVLLPKSIHFS